MSLSCSLFLFCVPIPNVNLCIVLISYNHRITRFLKVWSLLEFMSLSIYTSFLIEATHMSSHVGGLKTSNKKNKANLLKSLTKINTHCLIFIGGKRLVYKRCWWRTQSWFKLNIVYCERRMEVSIGKWHCP